MGLVSRILVGSDGLHPLFSLSGGWRPQAPADHTAEHANPKPAPADGSAHDVEPTQGNQHHADCPQPPGNLMSSHVCRAGLQSSFTSLAARCPCLIFPASAEASASPLPLHPGGSAAPAKRQLPAMPPRGSPETLSTRFPSYPTGLPRSMRAGTAGREPRGSAPALGGDAFRERSIRRRRQGSPRPGDHRSRLHSNSRPMSIPSQGPRWRTPGPRPANRQEVGGGAS